MFNYKDQLKEDIGKMAKDLLSVNSVYLEINSEPTETDEDIIRDITYYLECFLENNDEFMVGTATDEEAKKHVFENPQLVERSASYFSNYETMGRWFCEDDFISINACIRDYLLSGAVEEWVNENKKTMMELVEDFKKRYLKETKK